MAEINHPITVQIKVIDEVLRKMMEPPPEQPKRPFVLHIPDKR